MIGKGYIDSQEEEFFWLWLEELVTAEYVSDFKKYGKHEGLILSNEILNPSNKVLLSAHAYTPDFFINWTVKAEQIFFSNLYSLESSATKYLIKAQTVIEHEIGKCSIVDTKGSFQKHGGLTEFKINQKWMFDKYKLFVNIVKVPDIFEHTFVPQIYLKTKTGKDRKINFPIKTLQEYEASKINIQ
jgi:hypothetical protein